MRLLRGSTGAAPRVCLALGTVVAHGRVGIDRFSSGSDLEVEMRRRVAGIAAVAEVADNGSRLHIRAGGDVRRVPLEVRVVVDGAVGGVQVSRAAAEAVRR